LEQFETEHVIERYMCERRLFAQDPRAERPGEPIRYHVVTH
jgi:hypothetical protein